MLATVVTILAVALQAGAGLAGGTVTGQVLDAVTREPVVNAEVVLIPPPERFREAPLQTRTITVRTDERGRFVFANVMSDSYTVEASGDGYVSRMAGAPTVKVQVSPGSVVEAIELALSRGGDVSGRVLGPDGRPVSGAMVFTQRRVVISRRIDAAAPSVPPEIRFISLVPRVQAAADGKFVFEGLAPGEYFLRVTASPTPAESSPGSGRFAVLVPTYYPSTTDPVAGAMPVLVAAEGAVAIGDITMHEAVAVRVSGATRGDDGQPIAGVSVRLVPADAPAGALPQVRRMETRSSAAGDFVFDGVLPGSYLLVAVPLLVTNIDTSPTARGRTSLSWAVGGRAGAAGGSVHTESKDGVTVQFRDELGTQVPVTVADDAVMGLIVTVTRPPRP
jgi:hypothetical protein